MIALIHYQAAVLMGSQRWLPPVLLYVTLIGVVIQWDRPLLDSLGVSAAMLLPVAAWLVRISVGAEPTSSRQCTAAAAGPGRVHLSSVLTAYIGASLLGVAGLVYVVSVSDPHSSEGQVNVPVFPAVVAGVLASSACALFGTAVGALCNRPLLRSTAWAVTSTLLGALLVLVVSGSPANAAVKGLVTGSHTGTVNPPWGSAVLSLAVAALATALACTQASRRG